MTYIAVVSLYVLALLGISIYKTRAVKSADDFMVAGRQVPVYMLVATLICTWIGSGSLFGTAGLTFRTGISELWFSAGAWVGILVVYLIAARVRRIAQYTLTDLLEKRYSQLAKVLGTITIIIAYMVIAGYQFKGGGRFISILSDGSVTPETGMIIAAILDHRLHGLCGNGVHCSDRHFQRLHHAARDGAHAAVCDCRARRSGRSSCHHTADRTQPSVGNGWPRFLSGSSALCCRPSCC